MSLTSAYGASIAFANPFATAYLNTNPNIPISEDSAPNGSIRIIQTPGETIAHIEQKASGVWNDTGFRFSSSSVRVGRDMIVSAVAGHLETTNPSAVVGHTKGLIPHIEFNDDGTMEAESPIVKAEEIFVVFGGAVSEVQGTLAGGIYTIGINLGVTPSRILENSLHEVGTIGSSAPVIVRFFTGTDNTGFKLNEKKLPANALIANTQLKIEYDNDLGFEGGSNIFMEFTSTANFSLKIDSGGIPLTSHEAHELAEVAIYTENLMLDEDLGLMFDENLGPMFAIQFP